MSLADTARILGHWILFIVAILMTVAGAIGFIVVVALIAFGSNQPALLPLCLAPACVFAVGARLLTYIRLKHGDMR